jgi:hypothetical protein
MVSLMRAREKKIIEVDRNGVIVSAEIEPILFEDMNYSNRVASLLYPNRCWEAQFF